MESILGGLNNAQLKAVKCTDGPVLIVAGAGSGKTRVLTCRTAYLIERGVAPENILELTFTKKAATEMKERISAMVGARQARRIWMGTFHSVFIRFLREFSETLGYPHDFTIYDQSSSISAVKACIKQLGLDDKIYKPKDVLARISMAKNSLVSPSSYKNNQKAVENDVHHKKGRICDIYALYWESCRKSGVMDFDDILFNMNILLQESVEALESISSRFSHIMVDEYQDTNRAQYLILKKLAYRHRNLCVVGDDSQSIYAFRGARIENILNFQKDYPDAAVIRLEQNYRSTRNIVDAANSVIEKNSSRIPKVCFSEAETGEKIRLVSSYTDKDEASGIASEIISRIRGEKAQYQDFAILYRTNSQSRQIEEHLRKFNIPYVIYSGNSFFERTEVKDVMSYFNLVVNPNDDEAFKRSVNKPARGIGDTSVAALQEAARAENVSMLRAVYIDNLPQYGLKAAAAGRLRTFCDMILSFNKAAAATDAYELATKIALDSGIWALYKSDNSIEGQSRAANVEELLNSVKEFVDDRHNSYFEELQVDGDTEVEIAEADLPVVTLGEFLENISLLSNADIDDDEDSSNKVALMTVHSSKGLEFPYVHIAGMEENLFPSGSALLSPAEIEEERRLFYVALTRACKAVTLSYCTTRLRNGSVEENSPSRFISEIDSRYVENPLERDSVRTSYQRRPEPEKKTAPRPAFIRREPVRASVVRREPVRAAVADFTPSPVVDLRAGQRVEHNRFGLGRITSIYKDGPELKAKVVFDNYGEKMLLLRYAKIRIVEE